VHCSARTLQELPGTGQGATLSIERCSRRSDRLFGFLSDVEREWFRLLQTVQGVGAKVALSVLSTLSPRPRLRHQRCATKAMVARNARRGPKVAERMRHELKG